MIVDGKTLSKFILYFSMIHIGISYSGFIRLPDNLMYLVDLACVFLGILCVKTMRKGFAYSDRLLLKLVYFVLAILCYNLVTGILNLVSPIWLLRGVRGVFRFYILFIGILYYWTIEDVDQFFGYMIKLYPINFAVVVIQKILFGTNNDSVIGITGTYLPVYLTLVLAYTLSKYLRDGEGFNRVVIITIINFVIATWGDQRGYYFMFMAVILGIMILERMSLKKIAIVTLCLIAIVFGFQFMSIYAPDSFGTMNSLDSIFEYGTRTSGGYNVSRFGAFDELNDLFFHDNIFYNLFGMGLGTCEINSPFYLENGWLHYTWFTHQWTFLETGYIGLFLLLLFFVVLFFVVRRNLVFMENNKNREYLESCAIICIVAIITSVYFSMHRSNSGYFLYGIAAMIPVIIRDYNLEETE